MPGRDRTLHVGLCTTGLVLAAAISLLLASAAPAAPGDVYAVDRDADAVWKLGPSGGNAVALAQGAPPFEGSPDGITLGPDGFLYVADEAGKVFKVNRVSGDVDLVTDFGPGTNPIDVTFDPRGRLLALDYDSNQIVVVDRATGERSLFFDGPDNSWNSLAIQRNGTIFIGDEGDDKVWRLAGGVLTPIIENDPELIGLDGVLLSPDEHYLYVGSYNVERFARYDLRTGEIVKFPLPGSSPWSLALLPSNRLIFSDTADQDLATVPVGGGPIEVFSADPDLLDPREIVVEPRRCGGRLPTVVGTNAPETIRGSRFNDVISTLGGNDTVKGLAGRDIVCGGKGRDRLIGGKGRDRLLGQAGRDRIVGGAARDVCKGGPGRDRELRC